jgi:hypothetical protein
MNISYGSSFTTLLILAGSRGLCFKHSGTGWVGLRDLVTALVHVHPDWGAMHENDLREMAAQSQKSDTKSLMVGFAHCTAIQRQSVSRSSLGNRLNCSTTGPILKPSTRY